MRPICAGILLCSSLFGAATIVESVEGATLVVTSAPESADVRVDGRAVGTTPARVDGLAPGDHEVVVSKDGHLENRRAVTLAAQGITEHHVDLVALPPDQAPQVPARASQPTAAPSVAALPAATPAAAEEATQQAPAAKKPRALRRALLIGVPAAVALGGGFAAYRYATRNLPPVAAVEGITPAADGLAGLTTFRFDGSASSDPNRDPLSYTWDFGDSQTGTGVNATHVYSNAGDYEVTLTVSDGKLTSVVSGGRVRVGRVSASVDPTSQGMAGMTSYRFAAQPTSDPDGDTLTFTWTFGDGATATGTSATHVFSKGGRFTPTVSVDDSQGHHAQATVSSLTIKSLDGYWSGKISGFGVAIYWCFDLKQEGLDISGRFSDIYEDGTVAGSLTPALATTMTITQPSYVPFVLQGWFDDTLTNGGGVAFDYFYGGPGTYQMEKVNYNCGFWSDFPARQQPDVRRRAR